MSESSTFRFYVPRYAELLMDTYMVIDLPTIWSPYFRHKIVVEWRHTTSSGLRIWGTQMIESVELSVGGQVLQKMSGQYLYNLVERDWSAEKKQLYYQMTGNTPDLNDPANADGRNGQF